MTEELSRPGDGAAVGARGDRRQVTVLFADLVGYTPLAEALGEEALFEVIRPITERMIGCVKDLDGTVQDLTVRSFGVVRASDTPAIKITIEPSQPLLARQSGNFRPWRVSQHRSTQQLRKLCAQ